MRDEPRPRQCIYDIRWFVFIHQMSMVNIISPDYYRATRMHSADYAMARCLSVRLSVTRRYCVYTVIYILKVLIPTGTPLTGPNATGYEKITIFDQYWC